MQIHTHTTDVHTLCNNGRSTNVLELHKSSFTYFILTINFHILSIYIFPTRRNYMVQNIDHLNRRPDFRPIMKKSLAVVVTIFSILTIEPSFKPQQLFGL